MTKARRPSRTHISLVALSFAVGSAVATASGADYAAQETEVDRAREAVPGEIRVKATSRCIGLDWPLLGDSNGNATCAVQYRTKSGTKFRKALPLFRLRRHNNVTVGQEYPWEKWPDNFKEYARTGWARNALAGSVFHLEPGTEYVVKLTLSDPDGGGLTEMIAAKTRPIPTHDARGPVVDVTPDDLDKLRQLAQKAEPGTIINLHAGVYETGLSMRASGTAHNPIVIKAAGDGEVIFQGLGPTVRRGPRSNHGFLFGGSHWRIHGLIFKEWFSAILGNGNDVAVTRCKFLGGRTAISIRGEDWYIADNVMHGFQDPASGAFWPEGILLRGAGHVVCHNTITRHGDQISLEFRDTDIYGNDIYAASDDGIETDLGGPNLRIWGNRIYSIAHNGISFQPYLHGPCYLIRNQIAGCGENIFKDRYDSSGLILLHNTLVNTRTTSLIRHVYARNNLFVTVPVAKIGARSKRRPEPYAMRYRPEDRVNWSMDLDYNGYVGKIGIGPWMRMDQTFGTTVKLAESTGNERHGKSTTVAECFAETISIPRPPNAIDPAPMFRVRDSSPAVNCGALLPNINDNFQGDAPDMGAHELRSPEPRYGPRP